MLELRQSISLELMEALIRHAHNERASALAAMLKRIPVLVAASFQSLLSLTMRARSPRLSRRPIPHIGPASA